MKKIVCNSGCLCCVCEYKNDNIKKNFHDVVTCYQERGKCVKIVPMEYVLREVRR